MGQRKLGLVYSDAKSQTFDRWAICIAATLGQLSGAGRRSDSAGHTPLSVDGALSVAKRTILTSDRESLRLRISQELIFVHMLSQGSDFSCALQSRTPTGLLGRKGRRSGVGCLL